MAGVYSLPDEVGGLRLAGRAVGMMAFPDRGQFFALGGGTELLGRVAGDAPRSYDGVREAVLAVIDDERPRTVEQRSRRPDGPDSVWEIRLVPEFDDDGRLVSVLGIGRDVTEVVLQHEALERAARTEQLAQENARMRALLELRPALAVRSTPAEVLYEAADPYSRKVFIDRGTQHGIVAGSPVVNEAGILGQVTHAYALTAEVTLLSDKDAAIPVLNTRTQQRSAAFGGGGAAGGMELRFMSGNADVKVGDTLQTSGLDGVYPPGLAVATVTAVERRVESGFARIGLTPAANADGVRHVLVLEPLSAQLPARPAAAEEAPGKAERQLKTPPRKQAPAP